MISLLLIVVPITFGAKATLQDSILQEDIPIEIENLPEYVPGEIIIKFKEGSNIDSAQQAKILINDITSKRTLNIKKILPESAKDNPSAVKYGLHRIYVATYNENENIISLINNIKNNKDIEYAEPNYISYFDWVLPTDPQFKPYQWNLWNYGQYSGSRIDADIDAPEAWEIEDGNGNITIAILDSGVEWTHSDLSNNIWMNPDETFNGQDDDNNGYIDDIRGWDFWGDDGTEGDNNPMDIDGHGTKCAGVAAAVTNNGVYLAGVCPNCKIMALRCGTNGCPYTRVLPAIYYAEDEGAKILSMSFHSDCVTQWYDIIDYAYDNGMIIVSSAGNINIEVDNSICPCYSSNTICVGATNYEDMRWIQSPTVASNYGPKVDISAPGRYITTTMLNDGWTYSVAGTSMSVPHVAGMAALILSKYPELTIDQLYHMIKNSVDVWGVDGMPTPDQDMGSGRINLYKAVTWSCTDGTELNSCSTSKPKFCQFDDSLNLQLKNNCQSCGCPPNTYCSGNSCIYDGSSPIFVKTKPMGIAAQKKLN